MISTFWNNKSRGIPLLIGPSATAVLHQVINLKTVMNRGDLAGILLETVTIGGAPGAAKNLTVFYAFSNKQNRDPTQLATASASQVCALDAGGAGTIRSYSLPINYQGGDYLHLWFTTDAMTAGSQLDLDLTVLARTIS